MKVNLMKVFNGNDARELGKSAVDVVELSLKN